MAIEPGYKQLRTELIDPSPEQIQSFKLAPERSYWRSKKSFLQMVIQLFTASTIFLNGFSAKPSPVIEIFQPGLTEPILEFLEQKCGQSISYYVSSVRADILKNCNIPKVFKN